MLRARISSAIWVCVFASHSWGQQFYLQPWDGWADSHQSRVRNCDDPTPKDLIAMDDFSMEGNGTIDGIRWWGEILDRAQVQQPRQYYIAIYSDLNCSPGDLLFKECVTPQVEFDDRDCQEDPVAMFTSALSGFGIVGGQRYWLQISEDDDSSANPDVDDFRWAGRRPVQNCFALQQDSAGNITQPIFDPCWQADVDLSFLLRVN